MKIQEEINRVQELSSFSGELFAIFVIDFAYCLRLKVRKDGHIYI